MLQIKIVNLVGALYSRTLRYAEKSLVKTEREAQALFDTEQADLRASLERLSKRIVQNEDLHWQRIRQLMAAQNYVANKQDDMNVTKSV